MSLEQQTNDFFGDINPKDLIEKYGSPLYVYRESIIRDRAKNIKNLVSYPNFSVHYSAKANSNIAILQIIKSCGLKVDAMSVGEMYAELQAGFEPDQIMFVSNNVDKKSFEYAKEHGILTVVDSISQLDLYGSVAPNTNVAIRFNPGVGDGHHEKTITAGEDTKFGVEINNDNIKKIKDICQKHNLLLYGLHMHIGSLFLDIKNFLESGKNLLSVALQFEDLNFVDLGGGFGISYKKNHGELGLNMKKTSEQLTQFIDMFNLEYKKVYNRELNFKIEPGRYLVAEAGVLLGTVISTKENYGTKYIGTDIGFNSFMRPTLYGAYHDIAVFCKNGKLINEIEKTNVNITGNVCENSDNLAVDRPMPHIKQGDTIAIMDAGAYGHVMSSNYNNMQRPAEVLIREDESVFLIRERDSLESLIQFQKKIK